MKFYLFIFILWSSFRIYSQTEKYSFFPAYPIQNCKIDTIFSATPGFYTLNYTRKSTSLEFYKIQYLGWDNFTMEGILVEGVRRDSLNEFSYSYGYSIEGKPVSLKVAVDGLFQINYFYHSNGVLQRIENYDERMRLHGWTVEFNEFGYVILSEFYKKGKLKKSI